MILYQSNCKEIKVTQFCNCNIQITDKYDQYCDRNISYKDTVTLDIIIYNNSKNPQIIADAFTDHMQGWLNEVKIPTDYDGYYTIYHIIIPTVTWYNRNSFKLVNKYDNIYVTDGKNVYKIVDGDLVAFNVNSLIKLNFKRTNLVCFTKDLFLICHLQKCLLKYELNFMKNLQDKSTKFYKDFLWCSIEILKILIINCKLEEAEILIEELMSCGGLCSSNITISTTSDNNCNCNN